MTTIYVSDKTKLPARKNADLYPTEKTLIDAALKHVLPIDTRGIKTILDIGAGDGRWGQLAYKACYQPETLVGVEKRPTEKPAGFTDWYVGDFLTWKSPYQYDLIVSNPPYSVAEKVIRRGWDMLNEDGYMVMLLRLAFQAGIDRFNNLWKEIPPVMVAVSARRPSFYGGGTNGTDYGVYLWHKGPKTFDGWVTTLFNYEREEQHG